MIQFVREIGSKTLTDRGKIHLAEAITQKTKKQVRGIDGTQITTSEAREFGDAAKVMSKP